ncbi:hypothetical protein HDU83_002230 [Entophlyctis luteolus]|nr:hypothetical protein HDU82_000603 [Entophlyctis luteolus]KAJ3355945.1 hypothetical protein HDU83_002230 [Entophlyctis luteolus]KAJ3388575.1 hypothetical protein HDU84_009673 [Entophlyctis sp. JEL0112]
MPPLPQWLSTALQDTTRVSDAHAIVEAAEYVRMRSLVKGASPNLEGLGPAKELFGAPVTAFAKSAADASGRNRYNNIFPFDQWRVVLEHPTSRREQPDYDSIPSSKYINASFLDSRMVGLTATHPAFLERNAPYIGISGKIDSVGVFGKRYIASQGPLEHTTGDFWRMTWEQHVPVIVMLTLESERGVEKCFKYWPTEPSDQFTWPHGPSSTLTVVPVNEESSPRADMIIRAFDLTSLNLESGERSTRRIHQIHFLEWPDHARADPSTILDVIDKANLLQQQSRESNEFLNGPNIVHCSAGVGRTGTFCVIDSVLYNIMNTLSDDENTGVLDGDLVFQTVMTFKSQRYLMVQTFQQYVMCYDTVAAGLKRL